MSLYSDSCKVCSVIPPDKSCRKRLPMGSLVALMFLLSGLAIGCDDSKNDEPLGLGDDVVDENENESKSASRDDLCPCEHLQGVPPLVGTVVSWYSGLLEIQVEEVLRNPAPADAPKVGERVLGMFDGELPCFRGLYLPEIGDHVIAFLVPDSSARPWCCQVAACEPQCETQTDGGVDLDDSCLAECQRPASEACDLEFADVEVKGYMKATPFEGDSFDLARAGDTPFSATRDDLELIFEGGGACQASLGDVRDVLKGKEDAPDAIQPPQWRRSCPGLTENAP